MASTESQTVTTDSHKGLLAQLAEVAKARLDKAQRGAFMTFVENYYDQFPLHELSGRNVADVFGCVYEWWHFSAQFNPQTPKVRVFNPNLEEDGWLCDHTLVVVLSRNCPFLVDSIRNELNRRAMTIHTINSTVFQVQRDQQHRRQAVLGWDEQPAAPESFHQEALVVMEINRHSVQSDLQELETALRDVLGDVYLVVDDFQPMLERLHAVGEDLSRELPAVLPDERTEARDFARWLHQHFTFLGYTYYELEDTDDGAALRERSDCRLGLFREHDDELGDRAPNAMEAGEKRFQLSPHAVGFYKSGVRSRVHRSAYSDYVLFKAYDEKGRQVGEHRFLGLYTLPVYTLSPSLIPVVRRKVEDVMAHSGLDHQSHDGKTLRRVLELFPRDDLFQAGSKELFDTALGVAQLQERRLVRLFLRKDPFEKFVYALVYMPRDLYRTEVRRKVQQLLCDYFHAEASDYNTFFSESILVRTRFVLRIAESIPEQLPTEKLQRRIVEIVRSWQERLHDALVEAKGEEKAALLGRDFLDAFPASYRERFEPRTAVYDINSMRQLGDQRDIAMSFYQPVGAESNAVRFKIFHLGAEIELSRVMPILENLGMRVIGEHPYRLERRDGQEIWLHDFNLLYALPVNIDVGKARQFFQEAFDAIWHGDGESDNFNRLVLGARLSWREVSVLRAYARYMKQVQFNFSQDYIADTLANHMELTRKLIALFKASFDPRVNKGADKDQERIKRLQQSVEESLDKVANLNEDRIFRRYLELINVTLRTNFFQQEKGQFKPYISLKLAANQLAEIPSPKPVYEIFVYSPRTEGVHLRGGKVARGGLRWSDRMEDYRTEVLGLVKAQQVKNAVIVPTGAKGGFVAKQVPSDGGREAIQEEVQQCYRWFIRGLLDITDNLVDGSVVHPQQVVCNDEPDPYLVVAADKGTATFSDLANSIAEDYQFWLGDAFASGGSHGYDHKKMGITARGAWVAVQRHFRELGVNVQREPISVLGIGDMAGDVFGNGMLLSETIELVAAFNHLHIFIDPNPDADAGFRERQRLFQLNRSTWEDYDAALISEGGGVFSRAAKSIAITPAMKERFGIEADKLTPNELIKALLQAPLDLIWNGGIGTYVKGRNESHADVGDKANDALRINGHELRCRVIGEGGNLGITQSGRVEYCLNGGRCNTDFIDNSGGVDCSDHEVNIKILLNDVVSNGDMTDKQRNKLLEEMTESVAKLVLLDNYRQTQAISIAAMQAVQRSGEYRRLIESLVSEGRLDRDLEYIPNDETLLERLSQQQGLTRPELAVLLSYAKIKLKEELLAGDAPEDDYMAEALVNAFPGVLRERYGEVMREHRLRREIVATQISNDMLDNMGISFYQRLQESTGASAGDIARAYVTARDIFQLPELWRDIEGMDYQLPASRQVELMTVLMRLVRRASRWFLRNRRSQITPADEMQRFAEPIGAMQAMLPQLLRGAAATYWEERRAVLSEEGVTDRLAATVAGATSLYASLGIIEAAADTSAEVERVAGIYFALGDRLNLQWMAEQISEMAVDSHWQARAREALLDDLEWQQRALTVSVVHASSHSEDIDACIDAWLAHHQSLVRRWRHMVNELQGSSSGDFAMFSVALRELMDLAQVSQHCPALFDEQGQCLVAVPS